MDTAVIVFGRVRVSHDYKKPCKIYISPRFTYYRRVTCLAVFNHYGVHSSTASGPPSLQGKAMVLIAPKICFGETCLKPSNSDLSVTSPSGDRVRHKVTPPVLPLSGGPDPIYRGLIIVRLYQIKNLCYPVLMLWTKKILLRFLVREDLRFFRLELFALWLPYCASLPRG